MGYQKQDINIVDYQLYSLPNISEKLRGPCPESLETDRYFVCLGAAQTFGRFCPQPFPNLLQDRLGFPVLNLSCGGAETEWFLQQPTVMKYINNSKFAIVQIMSARCVSNSFLQGKRQGRKVIRKSDGELISSEDAYGELLQTLPREKIIEVVAETRENWVKGYQKLLAQIDVPTILFWFSKRSPYYTDTYQEVDGFFKEFPQLVNRQMIDQIITKSDDYIECISKRGLPQTLIDRFSGEPIFRKKMSDKNLNHNNYYPSPEMHIDAAKKLESRCQKYLEINALPVLQLPSKNSQKPIIINPDMSQKDSSEGKLSEEMAIYHKEITEKVPVSVYKDLAKKLLKRDKLSEILEFYGEALKLPSIQHLNLYKSRAFHTYMGDTILQLAIKNDQIKDVINYYQIACENHPKNPWLYYYFATALFNQNDLDRSIELYEKTISIESNYYEPYLKIANIKLNQGDREGAFDFCIKALKISPENYKVNQLCVRLFKKISRKLPPEELEKRVNTYQKEIERIDQSKENSIFSYIHLGQVLFKAGRTSEAIKYNQTAIRLKYQKSNPELIDPLWNEGMLKKPDFLVIGVMKCGTTALYEYMIQHPKIIPAVIKETGALHRLTQDGKQVREKLDYYFSLFPPRSEVNPFLTGEASVGYINNIGVAKIINQYFPQTKFIAILRDPVKRAISDYQMQLRNGSEHQLFQEKISSDLDKLEQETDLNKVYEKSQDYLKLGLYAYPLEQWMAIFPKEQFLILRSEDLNQHPSSIMVQVFEFLGLPNFEEIQYQPKNQGTYSDRIDENLLTRLYNFYQPHNQRLEQFLNRKFDWAC